MADKQSVCNTLPKVLGGFSKQATYLSDLLQGRYHPFLVGAQLLYEAVDPLDLLRIPVLQTTVNMTSSASTLH